MPDYERIERYAGRAVLLFCAAFAVAALSANACGGSPLSPSGAPNLRVLLTDEVTDAVEEVNLRFTSVTVKPSGGPVEHDLPLVLDPNPVNLLELTDGTVAEFAAGFVEPGSYEFLHLNIDARESWVVEDGEEVPLQVPSEEIKVLGGFTVEKGQVTTLTLDFDARASLVRLGSGGWLLKPVITRTAMGIAPDAP